MTTMRRAMDALKMGIMDAPKTVAGFGRAWERHKAREAAEKLQRGRPDELFPGANGTGEMLSCGHEQQSRGAAWGISDGQGQVDKERIVRALRGTMSQEDAKEAARAYGRDDWPCEGRDHQGRCPGCQHCGAFTAKHTGLW